MQSLLIMLSSKRVLEKESQGITTGFDLKAAKEVVNNKELN